MVPVLVELPKTHDVAPKAWDVVDISEGTMFSIDTHEHVPHPLMSTTDPSPSFTMPPMVVSRSVKIDWKPVMWLLPPMSKNH